METPSTSDPTSLGVVMSVDIDEAGSDHQAAGVNGSGRVTRRVADRHHPAVLYRHRALHARPPTAVKDEAAFNFQIVIHRDLPRCQLPARLGLQPRSDRIYTDLRGSVQTPSQPDIARGAGGWLCGGIFAKQGETFGQSHAHRDP